MKAPTGVRRTLLTGTALLATLGIAACGTEMKGMDHGAPTSAPAGAAFNDADVRFAQAMIPHHRQAVAMADLAATRASDAELKALAAQIKAEQDPEIATMTGWLTAWGRPTAASGHDMPGMGGTAMPGMMSETDMSALAAATGTAFDRRFAQMMIDHHLGAIEMARAEHADGRNSDATQLAVAIERAQLGEISALQKILDRL
ncbi:uncharacterized protein (DUF305 family) [Allocatelliglobosispora scoriae]|uniref:Uncharacterized protein (DUF305 family) n=1 Tax=Allocatelliglobosispora scoriae TaxID=643052 RepID=A0A841BKW0_9ACTN|nr:DUF305 domain-containing protein [Allocatelliglobosispora scoriae]MBB5867633.1 uncharacterized protein (DUF305 family) [Allocatelliglobosispora scoriae]